MHSEAINIPVDLFMTVNRDLIDLYQEPFTDTAFEAAIPDTEFYAIYGGLDTNTDGENHIQYIPPDKRYEKIAKINASCGATKRIASKGKLTILYECSCDIPAEKKLKHHPDYNKLNEVMLLCRRCHSAEHKRLRSLAMAQAVNE